MILQRRGSGTASSASRSRRGSGCGGSSTTGRRVVRSMTSSRSNSICCCRTRTSRSSGSRTVGGKTTGQESRCARSRPRPIQRCDRTKYEHLFRAGRRRRTPRRRRSSARCFEEGRKSLGLTTCGGRPEGDRRGSDHDGRPVPRARGGFTARAKPVVGPEACLDGRANGRDSKHGWAPPGPVTPTSAEAHSASTD